MGLVPRFTMLHISVPFVQHLLLGGSGKEFPEPWLGAGTDRSSSRRGLLPPSKSPFGIINPGDRGWVLPSPGTTTIRLAAPALEMPNDISRAEGV